MNGVNKVVKGVQDYTSGVNTLADGVSSYVDGEKQLAAGASQLTQLSTGLKKCRALLQKWKLLQMEKEKIERILKLLLLNWQQEHTGLRRFAWNKTGAGTDGTGWFHGADRK